MTLAEQLKALKGRLNAENDLGGQRDMVKVAELEQQAAEIQAQISKIEEEEQAAAQQVRIDKATEQAAYFLDNLVVEDLTMRELCGDETKYQMLRIVVQNKIISLAEENSRQISELQAEENEQQRLLKQQIEALQSKFDEESKQAYEDHETIMKLKAQLAQSQLEVTDYQSKLKNATDEITRLEGHVDDLRKEIAVGARNAYKVTDVEQSEQLKQLAAQIKASRIHVYDVEPDSEINPKNYTAKRADNGEQITYNWTQSKNYIEIKDAAEVERFRQQFTNQEAVSDIPLDQPVQDNVTPEATFPELPSAIPPNIPGEVPVVIPTPELSGQGRTVEERFEALERRVTELEKVCNLNEEAA